MQAEGDFQQIRRQVFDGARRLLDRRRPEQPPVTAADVAGDIGLEMPLVVQALRSLAGEHLHVKVGEDWQVAEIQGVREQP
jgi:hypothetical protein